MANIVAKKRVKATNITFHGCTIYGLNVYGDVKSQDNVIEEPRVEEVKVENVSLPMIPQTIGQTIGQTFVIPLAKCEPTNKRIVCKDPALLTEAFKQLQSKRLTRKRRVRPVSVGPNKVLLPKPPVNGSPSTLPSNSMGFSSTMPAINAIPFLIPVTNQVATTTPTVEQTKDSLEKKDDKEANLEKKDAKESEKKDETYPDSSPFLSALLELSLPELPTTSSSATVSSTVTKQSSFFNDNSCSSVSDFIFAVQQS